MKFGILILKHLGYTDVLAEHPFFILDSLSINALK